MRRFFLFVILLMLAGWVLSRHRRGDFPHAPSHAPGFYRDDQHAWRFGNENRRTKTQHALADVQHAVAKARTQAKQALDEARAEWRQAGREVSVAVGPGSDSREPKSIELSVSSVNPVAAAVSSESDPNTISSDRSASEERAVAEARQKLRAVVAKWLVPDVPSNWTPPERLVEALVLATDIEPIGKEYGENGFVYVANLSVDFSPTSRAAFVAAYTREVVKERIVTLGGGLAFALICLGALSSYIRADEATRGYYTNRLRMLAAAGVGAAGVIIYQMMA
jgi:hypothetical protein